MWISSDLNYIMDAPIYSNLDFADKFESRDSHVARTVWIEKIFSGGVLSVCSLEYRIFPDDTDCADWKVLIPHIIPNISRTLR